MRMERRYISMTTDSILLFLEKYAGDVFRENLKGLTDFFKEVYSVLQNLFEGLDLGSFF